jgi:two-component system phosphate regulon response regulator PhoB
MMNVEQDRPLVLIVDDYEDYRLALRLFLERRGCRVVEAIDGDEAAQAATREHPDLILMDISMPVLDGCAAMLRIREKQETRDVPIVAISACEYASLHPLLRMDACRAGLTEYLTKPFDPVQLESLVGRLLPTSSMTQHEDLLSR